jgi:hypothetical protein
MALAKFGAGKGMVGRYGKHVFANGYLKLTVSLNVRPWWDISQALQFGAREYK